MQLPSRYRSCTTLFLSSSTLSSARCSLCSPLGLVPRPRSSELYFHTASTLFPCMFLSISPNDLVFGASLAIARSLAAVSLCSSYDVLEASVARRVRAVKYSGAEARRRSAEPAASANEVSTSDERASPRNEGERSASACLSFIMLVV